MDARRMLVLGGARSGKSRRAEALAEASGRALIYIATAEALDDEMRERIACHRASRAEGWRTVEAPRALAAAIAAEDASDRVLVIDCLTLWLSNLLIADDDLEAAGDALAAEVVRLRGEIIFVSNEVGFGIVPDNALARRFRDAAGRLNQRIAAACDAVELVVAGIPVKVK